MVTKCTGPCSYSAILECVVTRHSMTYTQLYLFDVALMLDVLLELATQPVLVVYEGMVHL